MAAKRSPILGYNHNVRFRGIVFHIQTEDSGIINPHVFTHLFHGGVIISTRKLVYDPDANDEAVKALMQAQHKAVMKDLKRGTFDDKIDSYLGGTPGLLPREGAEAPAAEAVPVATAVAPPDAVDAPPPPIELFDPVGEAPPLDLSAPAIELEAPPGDGSAPHLMPDFERTIPVSVIPEMDAPPAAPRHGTTPPPVRVAFSAADARAPTEQVPSSALAAIDPDVGGAASAREDVSAAMRAIQVTDEELSAAGLQEVAEVHSPAPPSAPPPPGVAPERAGSYHLGRKTGVIEAARPPIPRPVTPAPGARPPPPPRAATPPPVPTRPTPVGSRVPTPGRTTPPIPQPRTATPPSRPITSPPRPPTPPGNLTPRSPTPPASAVPRPSTQPGSGPNRGRPASGGGVVVSRPAVIVGGKGTPTAPATKVRRAREAEGFGGDLISERSLDEVILAYLSEDTNDE